MPKDNVIAPPAARAAAGPPEAPSAAWNPAFQRLYDAHFDLVWRGLARLGTPEESLEDAVQDVFLVVHRKYSEFSGRSAFTTWLYGIATRVAKDHRRAATRHRRRVREFENSVQHSVQRSESPAEQVLEREAARLVMALLDQLPQAERELLVLVELEQLTVSEAAAALGLSVRTAQRRLHKARTRFDRLLDAQPPRGNEPVSTSPSRVMP